MAVLSCGVVPAGFPSLVRALVALALRLIVAAPRRRRPGAGRRRRRPPPPTSASAPRSPGTTRPRTTGATRARSRSSWRSQGIRFSADVADYYDDQHRLVAVGNVVFITPSSRISADRADFDTRTRTGTFFNAFGSASVSEKVDKSFFGTQEPDAFFYGETIEKIGVDRYRIHKGGFTTCVQPTPRWEVAASTVTLTVDKRAVLKNAVLKVKDVPLFYLPAMYYPINKEDRSTGFLLPVYGTSTIRGSSFSNAFFWAINRSQDVTLLHDWFTRTGKGYGGEYRYVASSGSNGEFRIYRLNERRARSSRTARRSPSRRRKSFEVRANVVQGLPGGLQARGTIDYFSDVTVQQQYQMDLYNATLRTRNYQGNVSGALGRGNTLSATYGINEVFYGDTDSQTIGGRPRIQFNRALTKLGALPLYFTGGGEYASIVRYDRSGDVKIERPEPDALRRQPVAAVPADEVAVHVACARRSPGATPTGPRASTRPAAGRGADVPAVLRHARQLHRPDPHQGLEHARERLRRALQARRRARVHRSSGRPSSTTTTRSSRSRAATTPIGGTTRVTYGVTNRFLARRRAGADGAPAPRAREFLNVQLQQSYYSNPRASTVDGGYSGGFFGKPPSNFSPIALTVRGQPRPTPSAPRCASSTTRSSTSSRRSRRTAPSTSATGCRPPSAGASASTSTSSIRCCGRRTTS